MNTHEHLYHFDTDCEAGDESAVVISDALMINTQWSTLMLFGLGMIHIMK